jgi:CubicO group peptidase (beta-lactamase class C family)
MVVSPVARSGSQSPSTSTANDLAARMMAPVFPPVSPPWNSPAFWSAEIPVTNGICTARALASIYGEVARDGGALVSADAVAAMASVVYDGVDEVQQIPVRRTLGFELAPPWEGAGRPDSAFGHPGAGGFIAFADPVARLGFAYVKNAGSPKPGEPDPRGPRVVRALYESLN